MKYRFMFLMCCFFTFCVSAHATQQQMGTSKPGKLVIDALKVDATVEAIDYDKRDVTLKGPKGNSYTMNVGAEARNFKQIEVGDTVTLQIVEAINIQVYSADQFKPGAVAGTIVERAKLGEKPAGVVVDELVVVATVENIDLENSLATLKNAEGVSHTVEVQDTEKLKKVAVGDQVVITYTEAIAIEVKK